MKNILDRINQLSIKERITITALERKIGASKGVLSRAIKNQTDIQAKWVIKIVEKYPLYDAYWLLTGKGEMLRTEGSAGPPSADQAEILELLRWKVERLEEENKKLKGEISILKRELDQSPPGIRKSELKK